LPVVGALSEFLVLETRVGGKTYVMRVERGEVVSPLRCVGEAAASGTRITFKPDAEIFGEVSLGMPAILRICRERARVQENVQFVVTDRTPTMPTETNIVCRAGLREVVGELGLGLRVFPEAGFHVAAEYPIVDLTKPVVLSSAVAFTRRSFARISSFVNFTASAHGGTHAQGFKAAMDGAFELARVPRGDRAALRRGMIGAVHVFHPSPRWEGCTRSQVSSPELEEVVREALMPGMARWMEENLVEIVGERVMAGV
jgi:DNA gyrase subunit B